jgi:Flp pilus assembly protein TadG
MLIGQSRKTRRRGATAVETALVVMPLLMMIFGIFCRYALANNQDPNITTDVQTIVLNYMAGRNASFSGFTVTVSGVHTLNGTSTSYTGSQVNNLSPGDVITVTVTGSYQLMNIIPLVPKLGSFSVTSSVTMICEGGV